MSTTHEIEIPLKDDLTLLVEISGDAKWENDGIGPYEYWGFKGFDHGHTYLVIEEITWDKEQFTQEENQIIEIYISKNFEELELLLTKKAEKEYEEYEKFDD